MKNLIYKELKLVIAPFIYMFPLLSSLLLVPNYPYAVALSYCIYGIFVVFSMAQVNKDLEFTANLPVPRSYIVYSRYVTVIYLELVQILVAIPCALITDFITNTSGNLVGMDANFAFFGIGFIGYGIFNAFFLPSYFKTGYKLMWPLVKSLTVYVLFVVATELVIAFTPAKGVIDGLSPENMPIRLAVLFVGIVIYIVLNFLSSKKAVKNFQAVNI